MLRFEDDCVGCPQGCIHCGRKHTPYFYCDKCGGSFEPEALYDYDDEMLCADCLLANFDTVAQNLEKWGDV